MKVLFCVLFFTFFLGMFGIAEFLTTVITVNTVMPTVYVALVLGFIYLIKD